MIPPPFNQSSPQLSNQYDDDSVLRSYLKRVLSEEILHTIEPELRELGELSGGELYQMQLADRLNEPMLTQWDAWGNRIDHIEEWLLQAMTQGQPTIEAGARRFAQSHIDLITPVNLDQAAALANDLPLPI
jgi:hypothetical protein